MPLLGGQNSGIQVFPTKNERFDKIIIDNSSGISIPSINQLSCSNKSITVIRPTRYGVESTYDLIETIYKKLRHFDSDSVRQDYLVWNQVPSKEDISVEPLIEKYLKDWTLKFADVTSRIPPSNGL